MRAENINHGKPELDDARWRLQETFFWVAGLDAFDFGDPEPLSILVGSSDPIPNELRPAFADIIAGRRKPNKRAAAKLKMKPFDPIFDSSGADFGVRTLSGFVSSMG